MGVIDSCSCPMFCQCFLTGKPPAVDGTLHRHATATQHFFQFDQAYPLNSGHSGSVPLYGTGLWFLGNVANHPGKAKLAWSILSFDPDVSAEQRNALLGVLRRLRWYRPERWKSCAFGTDAPIEWAANKHGMRDIGQGPDLRALSGLDAGFAQPAGQDQQHAVFGDPRNRGFILMPSTLAAYRGADYSVEFTDEETDGIVTTVEMSAARRPV